MSSDQRLGKIKRMKGNNKIIIDSFSATDKQQR
jgi:hypothetical protein